MASKRPLPLARDRATAIIADAPRDPFGTKTNLRSVMTNEECVAVQAYWMHDDTPTSWGYNDVIRHCAKAGE